MSCRTIIVVFGITATVWLGCDRADRKPEYTYMWLSSIDGVLKSYKSDIGAYPTTQQGLQALRMRPPDLAEPSIWNGPYAKKDIPLDPWHSPFVYRRITEDQFELYSTGPDGKDNTDDDVGR